MKAYISFSARSHMGKIRANNEDNLYCAGSFLTPENRDAPFALSGGCAAPCLFAVFDGMGGQECGEEASFIAAGLIPELESRIKAEPADQIDGLVQEYVTEANERLCAKMREKSVRMGTTVALLVVTENAVRPYNIGDSRIYELSGGKFSQISEDHTLIAQKVKMGVLTAEQARADRDRHKLTQYLGIFEDEMSVVAEPLPALPLSENRRILLCSDGLTDMVRDEKIEEILRRVKARDAAGLLLNEALAGGGKDNITCVVIDIKSPDVYVKRAYTKKIAAVFSRLTKRGGRL